MYILSSDCGSLWSGNGAIGYKIAFALTRLQKYNLKNLCCDLKHGLRQFADRCEAAEMRISISTSEPVVLGEWTAFWVWAESLPKLVMSWSCARVRRAVLCGAGCNTDIVPDLKRELSQKGINVPTLTYGSGLWVMTKQMRLWIQWPKGTSRGGWLGHSKLSISHQESLQASVTLSCRWVFGWVEHWERLAVQLNKWVQETEVTENKSSSRLPPTVRDFTNLVPLLCLCLSSFKVTVPFICQFCHMFSTYRRLKLRFSKIHGEASKH